MNTRGAPRFSALLRSLYEKPRSSVAFSAPHVLFREAKKSNAQIKLSDVKQWLAGQSSYTHFKRVKRTYPRRKVVVSGVQIQYQADLVDFVPIMKENNGYRYLLTVIDCFSRFAVAIPQKKKTANITLLGMKKAFKCMHIPKVLQTDDGGEFFNREMNKYLSLHKIRHFHTNQDVKAQLVERFNRTIRERIYKYMTSKKSLRYIDALPDLLYAYNARPHSAFAHRYAPRDVTKRNEKKIYDLQYGEYLRGQVHKHKYQVNDIVLLAKSIVGKNTFAKRTKTYYPDFYQIIDQLDSNPLTYRIKKLKKGVYVDRSYYEHELQKVNTPDWYDPEKNDRQDTERPSFKIMKLSDGTLVDRFKADAAAAVPTDDDGDTDDERSG